MLAAFIAFALAGCGQGGGAAPAPLVTAPGAGAIGYATVSGGRGQARSIDEYPAGSTSPLRTIAELGGASIRFDVLGTLWSDRIGSYAGYHPDGSSAGEINLPGALLSFDGSGNLYVATCCSVDVYAVGAANTVTLSRSIAISSYACSAAADGAGNLYVATCTADLTGTRFGSVSMYAPGANGNAAPLVTDTTATGPLTVDPSGNLFAAYAGTVGVWPAGSFGSAGPSRTLPLPAGLRIADVAVDRGGSAYVVAWPLSAGRFPPATLFYVAAGARSATTLRSGAIDAVTVPLR